MTAMVIFQTRTRDAAKLAEYGPRALASVTMHGGNAVLLGPVTSLHGENDFDHGALFAFSDREAAEAWYSSGEYRALGALRDEAMDCAVTIVG